MIPEGLCQCGCGQRTNVAVKTRPQYGHVKGEYLPFVQGHRKPKPIEDRFWQKVKENSETGCWEWQGALSNGYGAIGHGTRDKHTMYQAHRWAYEYVVAKIPEGLQIDHLCRNRRCVNPAHLEPVTIRENLRRGNGWAGLHARKTHCPAGHPLEGDNLSQHHLKHGQRKCLACHAARQRAYKAAKRVAKQSQGVLAQA